MHAPRLRATIQLLIQHGLDQTGGPLHTNDGLDLAAAVYTATTGNLPAAFRNADDSAGLALIHANPQVMDTLRYLSQSIDHVGGVAPGPRDDYAEHVSQWATTPGIGQQQPPTLSEVIGRLLRAAQDDLALQPGHADDWGNCLTCGGHGTVDGDEIPFDQLSRRRQQGHAHGHRWHRSKPCPHCDGTDRATPALETAAGL